MTQQFGTNTTNAEESNLLWSNRTSIRHHYGEPAPFLSPGTIVQQKGDKHEFLICVQQDCDCRRIPRVGKEFIFLPAVLVLGDQAK